MCSLSEYLCGCGFDYTAISQKTRQAMALIFAKQLRDILTYILAKYGRFLFSSSKHHFLKKHQGYSSRFFKNWGSKVGNEIEPVFVRIYVYMS